jgi:glycine cleavage system H protein
VNIPEDLRYSVDHEWVKIDGNRARIGITDYAQDALGDVVYVEMPKVGTAVVAGESLGEVESTKSVSEVYAPVGGVIATVNPLLAEAPERLNSSPYDEGWICEIDISDPLSIQALLDAASYRQMTEG